MADRADASKANRIHSNRAQTMIGYSAGALEQRDLRLDACRGLALWFTFIDHIPNNPLSWLTLRYYGFSDASEVFVFVSGYTCMIAYGGALADQGWPTIITRSVRRAMEIYAAFILLLALYFAMVWLAGGSTRYIDETNTGSFFREPGATMLHALLLQYAAVNTDILPTFVFLHLAFPALLWLMIRSTSIALAISCLLYVMVQLFDWNIVAWPSGWLYFNPLAWQLLFVLGAWYAYQGSGVLKAMVGSQPALIAGLAYLALSLFIALSWQIKPLEAIVPAALGKALYPIDKSSLSPLRVLHFIALAVVVAHLTTSSWRHRMNLLIIALIRCGENALPIYCVSVLLSFAAIVFLNQLSGGTSLQVAVSLAGIGVMIAFGTLLTWMNQHDRLSPKLF
jgi:hypothetical protein